MRQYLEADLLLFANVLGLLLHNLEDALAGGTAILRLTVNGDGLLKLTQLAAAGRLHFPTTKRENGRGRVIIYLQYCLQYIKGTFI